MRHTARAARLAMLFHLEKVHAVCPPEPIAIDGFESFEYSQYFRFHINWAAGIQSWFIWGFTDSPLRRKGRMTVEQKRRRQRIEATLGVPDPKAVENSMKQLLDNLLAHAPLAPFSIHSDDHPAYPRAIRRHQAETGRRIRHSITPGSAPRTTSNPLFPVNLADMLLRHAQANHRRETIAFSKRRQSAIERVALFLYWRNYVKARRESSPGETAAMRARIVSRRFSWSDLLRRRRFPRPETMTPPFGDYYWRRVRTLALGGHQRRHLAKYAF